jgi:hypothetical protein
VPAPSHSARAHRKSRIATVIVLLISFVAMSFLQNRSQRWHQELVQNTGSEAKISNLDSFSLALLLGGFRGPLVMMLWSSSEAQKQSKDLEDFDSKIELIRLLQPEFDSVHIFQMWNKAYNISVQMANNSDKYATIVDALEYGYRQNAQHPDDMNILSSIGRIFFDKLGGSQEQDYYTKRVERETFPDVRMTIPAARLADLDALLKQAGINDATKRNGLTAQARQTGAVIIDKLTFDALHRELNGPGVEFSAVMPAVKSDTKRRIRLDPILDLNGNLTPEAAARPELQFLTRFQPFPYGVPPMAIGCAYFKQCQILKDRMHTRSLEQSDLVVDNRPAINTENWAEKEWGWGRRAEMIALGKGLPVGANYADERDNSELPTADVSPAAPVADRVAAEEALYHYSLIPRIAVVCEQEFQRHATNYPAATVMFSYHRQQLRAMSLACLADRSYLTAMLLPVDDGHRPPLLADAARNYRMAMLQWEVLVLKHELPDELMAKVVPHGVQLEEFVNQMHAQSLAAVASNTRNGTPLDELVSNFTKYLEANPRYDVHHDDRVSTLRYIQRAFERLVQLRAAPGSPN